MQPTEPIRVAIVEDDRLIREGLAALINGTAGFRCVGAFGSMEEALRLLSLDVPDVLLLDIHLPGMSGSEGARLVKERFPSVSILMLTVYEEDELVFDSLCNGACGYLLKRTPPAKLLDALREVHEGGSPMSPEIARKLVNLYQKIRPHETLEHDLTPQELRLLSVLAQGASYKAAADQFHVSVNTIRKYIKSIYSKLHVHSKSEAVGKALKGRII